jgi:microcystin-dependent protein
MADQFVGEVRVFGFNFAPSGWAFCDGQLLPISQNTALFSLLGTQYGGNGTSNFALPNLQGNVARGQGQGPGLSLVDIGETSGTETVTVLTSEMPQHNHLAAANNSAADSSSPAGEVWAPEAAGTNAYASSGSATMSPLVLGVTGGNQPHNNLQPYLVMNFCIALQGIYPARQ